ncbi:MAG: hypothetical protein WC233_08080 [Sphaerochaeta sp.]
MSLSDPADRVYTHSEPLLFGALKGALREFVAKDESLLLWPKAKASIAHVLALRLGESCALHLNLPESMQVDIMAEGSDVIVHDRDGNLLIGLVFSTTYLTQAQHDQLRLLQKRGCKLVIGIAFLKEKEYFLLYHPKRGSTDYYHYRRHTSEVVLLRERDKSGDDGQQLLLSIKERKKRKKTTPDR